VLVQAVARFRGETYCAQCQRLKPCTTLTMQCKERGTTVSHAFCEQCVREGIGIEVALPDPQVQRSLARRRRMSRLGERATAREIGGKLTPNSGATRGDGDVLTDQWMVEEKKTTSKSYRLSVNQLDKTKAQAHAHQRDWVMRIRMPETDLAVVDWNVLRGLVIEREPTDRE